MRSFPKASSKDITDVVTTRVAASEGGGWVRFADVMTVPHMLVLLKHGSRDLSRFGWSANDVVVDVAKHGDHDQEDHGNWADTSGARDFEPAA